MGTVLAFLFAALAALCLWGPASVCGSAWSWKTDASLDLLVESTSPSDAGVSSVPLLLELLGTALESGLTLQGALKVVANVADEGIRDSLLRVVAGLDIGASWLTSWEGNLVRDDVASIHEALNFAALTGASAAPLLYAEAQQRRTADGRTAEKRAAALGVKLVLPLGLCSLPAFIALGIVPVVIAMVPAL